MDLSKLPKLSKTSTPGVVPGPAEAPAAVPADAAAAAPNGPKIACPYCAAPLRAGARFCDNCGSPVRISREGPPPVAAEAWISIGFGIILLLIAPNLIRYGSSKIFHTHFAPYVDLDGHPTDSAYMTKLDASGQTIVSEIRPYVKTNGENDPNFQSDLAVTLFAFALIVEGMSLVLSRRTAVVLFALLLTVAATLYNLGFLILEYSRYGQLAIIPAVAVLLGGYMVLYQAGLFMSLRQAKPRPASA